MKVDLIILNIIVVMVIVLIFLLAFLSEGNYECITIDNELIKCKKIYYSDGLITGITENKETYIIKSYKEITEYNCDIKGE